MLPTDAKARKAVPICTGVLDYFPDALAAVAEVSRIGNDQHNPGQPLHWAKGKSTDHADCLVRHLSERGTTDTDGGRHSAKVAWRALALLQTEIEDEREKAAKVPEQYIGLRRTDHRPTTGALPHPDSVEGRRRRQSKPETPEEFAARQAAPDAASERDWDFDPRPKVPIQRPKLDQAARKPIAPIE